MEYSKCPSAVTGTAYLPTLVLLRTQYVSSSFLFAEANIKQQNKVILVHEGDGEELFIIQSCLHSSSPKILKIVV